MAVPVPSSSFAVRSSDASCSTVNLHIAVSSFMEHLLEMLG